MHHGTVAVTVELVKRDTEREKLQYENAVEKQDSSLLERRKGHPSSRSTISSTFSSSMEATDLTTHLTRSMANPFNNELCFFCQEDKQNLGMLYEICTFNAEEKLQQAIKAGQSDDLRVRLSTAINPSDARAIDVKYHLPCWVKNIDRVLKPKTSHDDPEECEKHCNYSNSSIIAPHIEFFSLLKKLLAEGSILTITAVQDAYINIMKTNGVLHPEVDRKKLKKLIQEHIPDIKFSRPSQCNQPE